MEYPAEHANDAWMLPNGNILFNSGHGVKEVTPEKEIVWTHQDFVMIKGASCIQVLDVPGDVVKGEVFR